MIRRMSSLVTTMTSKRPVLRPIGFRVSTSTLSQTFKFLSVNNKMFRIRALVMCFGSIYLKILTCATWRAFVLSAISGRHVRQSGILDKVQETRSIGKSFLSLEILTDSLNVLEKRMLFCFLDKSSSIFRKTQQMKEWYHSPSTSLFCASTTKLRTVRRSRKPRFAVPCWKHIFCLMRLVGRPHTGLHHH